MQRITSLCPVKYHCRSVSESWPTAAIKLELANDRFGMVSDKANVRFGMVSDKCPFFLFSRVRRCEV